MTANAAARAKGLALFRSILKLHRVKLPAEMRGIGDAYVRKEFRAHKEVNETQWEAFVTQWTDYKAHLELEADILGIGRDLADDTMEALSDDQKEQLDRLRASAMRVASQQDKDQR